MGINFQPGVNVGDTIIQDGKTWVWDGDKWSLKGGAASGGGLSGDFVEKIGDTMTGDLLLKDVDGNTSAIDFNSDEATAVHKKYVDQRINNIDLTIDIDHGAWGYELPDIIDHIGTAALIIPTDLYQITPYTLEVQWDGGIDESDVVIEWTVTRNGVDISSDILSTHVTRSYVGAAKVTATFTEEGEHEISCKITSNLADEEFITSASVVDIQFYDGLPKIGDVVISPKKNLVMGQTTTYTATNNGDADDVQFAYQTSLKSLGRPRIFDRERCLDAFEKAIKPALPLRDYNIQLELVIDAMDRWEALFQYNEDLYWSLWYSSRNGTFDSNLDADHPRNLDWNGLYWDVTASEDPNTSVLATGGPGGDYDSEVLRTGEGNPMIPRSMNLWLNSYKANRDNTNESESAYRFSFGKLWVHEIGHGFLLTWLPSGWYEIPGYPAEYYDNNVGHVFHESRFPRTVQAYREITGNNSFDRIHGKAPREGHWPWVAQTFDGVTYPGWKGIMSTGPKIDKVCVGLLADFGWEEINPGTSEEDNPEIVNTFQAISDMTSDDPFVQHILSHYETSQYYTPHEHIDDQLARGDLRQGGGVDIYEPADVDKWGIGVKDFSTPVESTNNNQYTVMYKHPGTWDITTTATSVTANDGPKVESIDQVVIATDTKAIDLFVAPLDDIFIKKPNPGTYHLFDDAGNVTGDYELAKTIRISNTDLTGSDHTWNKIIENHEVTIKNLVNGDYLDGQITQIVTDPSDDYIELKVDLIDFKGFTSDGDEANIKFLEGNNLYVKVEGDTMEGPLEIKYVDSASGLARLKLNGKTGSTTNNCTSIEFACQDNTGYPGYLYYYTKGTSGQKFIFTRDVSLNNSSLRDVDRIYFRNANGVGITWNDQERINFYPGSDTSRARTEIVSASTNQHTFTIRGSTGNTNTLDDRVLTVVHRSSTADDVYYNGRTNQANNIMTRTATEKGFVQGGGFKITESNGVYYITSVQV